MEAASLDPTSSSRHDSRRWLSDEEDKHLYPRSKEACFTNSALVRE